MNIYEALREDHDKHRTLLDLLVKTSGDSEGRRELFEKCRMELEAHANAEEQAFYAALLKNNLTQEKGRHSVAEHKDIADLLEELDKRSFSDSHWLEKAKQLKELVEHHMDEEEHEVFQLSGKALGEAEKERLAVEFQQLKARELREVA